MGVVACMVRSAAKGSFKANVHQGGAVSVFKPKKAFKKLVLKTAELCKLDVSGCDLMMAEDGYKICEVNSSPGFEGLERATGVDVAGFIFDYILGEIIVHRDDPKTNLEKIEPIVCPLQPEHINK